MWLHHVIICPIAITQHGTDYKIICVISVCPCSHRRNFYQILTKHDTDVWNLKWKNPFVVGQNPVSVPLFSQHITPNWHLYNALLEQASDKT